MAGGSTTRAGGTKSSGLQHMSGGESGHTSQRGEPAHAMQQLLPAISVFLHSNGVQYATQTIEAGMVGCGEHLHLRSMFASSLVEGIATLRARLHTPQLHSYTPRQLLY